MNVLVACLFGVISYLKKVSNGYVVDIATGVATDSSRPDATINSWSVGTSTYSLASRRMPSSTCLVSDFAWFPVRLFRDP